MLAQCGRQIQSRFGAIDDCPPQTGLVEVLLRWYTFFRPDELDIWAGERDPL